MSQLLQDDIQHLLDNTVSGKYLKMAVHDSGITPASYKSPPRAVFFIHRTDYYQQYDWIMQQKYAGGMFYSIVLKIDDEIITYKPTDIHLKYDGNVFIKCAMSHGMSWDARYSGSQQLICSGIYCLLDIPNATEIMAQKIINIIEKMRDGHIIVEPH